MKTDEFVGQLFGENNQIEVISKIDNKYYLVKCNECCKDEEMFGDGIFKVVRRSLLNKHFPCGCSKRYRLTEEQSILRINRVCTNRNIKFLGFIGEYRGISTRVCLLCNLDGNVWETSFSHIVNDGRGCRVCASKKIKTPRKCIFKDVSSSIQSFMQSGVFHKDTIFWRVESLKLNRSNIWNYSCPICSFDEYVENGVCSGIFEATAYNLQSGKVSCRCSSCYKWTREQREYSINKLLTQRHLKYKYNGVDGVWKGNRTKLKFVCPEHGDFSLSLKNFLRGAVGCSSCSKTGFDRNKIGYIYVLKVNSMVNSFAGYGISNVPRKRLVTHYKSFKSRGCLVEDCMVFKGDGKTVQDIERRIIDTFETYSQDIPGFIREATLSTNYQQIIDLIVNLELEDVTVGFQ